MQPKLLTNSDLQTLMTANSPDDTKGPAAPDTARPGGKMTLMEAAFIVERLQRRAAHAGELEALKIARDAILTVVSEGYRTLGDRLRRPPDGTPAS